MSKTEIVFILDKSGSMHSIKNDAIGGFNNFIEEQKKIDGKVNLTLVLFDSYVNQQEVKDINSIEPLNEIVYKPSGGTALVDAIGKSIDNLNKRLSEQPVDEQPDNIIFAIMTDGEENMSIGYSAEQVKNKIENMRTRDYQFIFLGANIDAVETAKGLGIDDKMAGQFVAKGAGASSAIMNASEMVMSYATTGKMLSYDDAVKATSKATSDSATNIGEAVKILGRVIEREESQKAFEKIVKDMHESIGDKNEKA